MTDNEIIKALECCSRHGDCEGCPWENDECITAEGTSILMHEALDLINRQKAEIERLQSDNDILSKNMHNLCKELDAEKLKNF